MKFLFLQGKWPSEIHREPERVLENNGPSEQTVQRWFRLFQEGRTSVEDNERSGRPLEVSSPEMVQQMEFVCRSTTDLQGVGREGRHLDSDRAETGHLKEASTVAGERRHPPA